MYNRLDALCSSLADPRNQHRGWRVLSALLSPKTPRLTVLAIAVAHGFNELALAEQLADALAAATLAVGAPAVALRVLYVAVFVRGGERSTHAQAIRSLCEDDFTFHELQRVLCRGRRRSAPWKDGVTHQMLRNLDDHQLAVFNGFLRSGCLPESWRCALVVPVLKRGKPPRSLASYKPVSLMSVPIKTIEAMALSRLQWIADILAIFLPEQCGFRAHRSTADCLSAVVGTLEQASRDGRAAFLLLLDVQSAFDCLPHATIISLGWLTPGVRASLPHRQSVCCLCRAGDQLAPFSEVQRASGDVLSPFLFNLALAPISECVPSNGHLPVRAVVYADDVALFVRGPPSAMRQMRMQLQAAVDAVGDFLRAIGLHLSAAKWEAIMVHPGAAARRRTGCVVVDGVPLPWRLTVCYLGLTIDHRLTWYPAVKQLRAAMRRVEGAVRAPLARGALATPLFAVGMCGAVALSKALYALPLCSLRPHLWRHIDCDNRRVLRMCHGLLRASRLAETLAEAGAWPVSLTADLRALGHIERLSRAPGDGLMLS
ncbi:hypothetical protein HPB49_006771 [Dermacentor silvarum]|uniref:Uncharacterized protein n=1 Tax=Dermacentor silvarum TaxID=543639 RepID=A0ACB8DWB3_DERSI|nr:hypothetical protein HPB49_006771 [Dermacentor silvarum]